MNLALILVFVALAYFLLETGMTFFAFLSIILLVLVVLGSAKKEETPTRHGHAASHHSGHEIAEGDRTHRFTVKDPWQNQKNIEDAFQGAGAVFFWPLKQLVGFMRRHGR